MARTDGRRLRREQNREAVVDALLALYAEGRYTATAAEVTERAGLSPRSLFRYFDDTDDLARAAIRRSQEAARKLLELDVGPEDPLEERIDALVAARGEVWEALAPAARASRLRAHSSKVVADELARGRRWLRQQVQELFAPELEAAGAEALAVVDVLCAFETYELMRHDQGLSRARARAATAAALTAVLRGGDDR